MNDYRYVTRFPLDDKLRFEQSGCHFANNNLKVIFPLNTIKQGIIEICSVGSKKSTN